ncbi:maleylacetate reductase [Amycolatopsis sp. NPDC004378]
MFVHEMPATRVVFAPGARHQLSGELAALGLSRVVLIGGAPPLGAVVEEIVEALGETVGARIQDVVEHVPVERAGQAARITRAVRADGLVSVGGGSATGLAKIVALRTGLPLVAVPTTYAGSEMTDIWGTTERGVKSTGRDPRVRPSTVVYDPELTVGVPPALTAASGLNALAHCVEAVYDTQASPIIHLLAVRGAHALASALPRAVSMGDDLTARGETLFGAWLAGTALGVARMGAHHRLCHILGGAFGMPHAETHAAVLPHVVAFNEPAATAALEAVATAMGASHDPAGAIWDLCRRLGTPPDLRSLGLSRGQALEVASRLAAHPGPNPRPVTEDDAREIVLAAFDGGRPELRKRIG